MVFRANSRGFTDIWLGSSDRLRMALQEHGTWGEELGIWTWAKRVDHGHLSRLDRLVRPSTRPSSPKGVLMGQVGPVGWAGPNDEYCSCKT